jgi:hypothetical protein
MAVETGMDLEPADAEFLPQIIGESDVSAVDVRDFPDDRVELVDHVDRQYSSARVRPIVR